MSLEAVKQDIETELHSIVNAGHEFGIQKVADLLRRMWNYFHTAAAAPVADAKAATVEMVDYAQQRVDALETKTADLEKHVVESVGSRLADLTDKVDALGATAKADAAKVETAVEAAPAAVEAVVKTEVAAVETAVVDKTAAAS